MTYPVRRSRRVLDAYRTVNGRSPASLAGDDGSWLHVAWIAITACVGIAALAAGTQKWLLAACNQFERWVLIACGLLLVYPAPAADFVGLAGFGAILAVQWLARRRRLSAPG